MELSVITLMEFESHLRFKRDVRYQSVRKREKATKESRLCEGRIRAQVFEVFIQSFSVIGVSVQKENT